MADSTTTQQQQTQQQQPDNHAANETNGQVKNERRHVEKEILGKY
jgi:hypothetical protein